MKADPDAVALADKVARYAVRGLAPLEIEMQSWDAKFKEIVWTAVAEIATQRARECQPSSDPILRAVEECKGARLS